MPGGYKLRLGDGTVLAVDHGSLATWLVDRKAMVQEEGSNQWHSLHEYLAAQRVAARRAARKAPTGGPLPLIPPPPKDQPIRRSPPTPAPSGRDALPLIPPPPKDQPIRKPDPPVAPPPPAVEMVPAFVPLPPVQEPPRTWMEPAPSPPVESVPLLAIAEAAASVGGASLPPAAERPATEAPPVVVKVQEVRVLAEELAPRYPTSPDDSAPPIPVLPPDEFASPPGREALARAEPPARQSLGVLAEDPWGGRAATAGPFEPSGGQPGDALPAIRLKPSDSFDRLPAAPVSRPPADDEVEPDALPLSEEERWRQLEIEELLQKPAVAATLRGLAIFGGILSQLLGAAARVESKRRARRAPAPGGAPSVLGLLLDRGRAAAQHLQQRWRSRLSRAPSETPGPSVPVSIARAADPPAPIWRESFDEPRPSPPRPAQAPPPPLEALPKLRLAEVADPEEEDEDLYEGGGWSGTLLPAVWRWTKLVVVLGALGAAGAFAALNWERWFPKAGEIGQQALSEIDRRARSAELAQQELRLIEEGAERLPQLAPETIRLLLARAPGGSLAGSPAIFRAACDAADRGLGVLSPAEAEELQGLRVRLLAPLRSEERERVRAYDRARASGAVFPFDDTSVSALVAQGVRALTPAETERLQALLGKAIAAGMTAAEAPAAPAGR